MLATLSPMKKLLWRSMAALLGAVAMTAAVARGAAPTKYATIDEAIARGDLEDVRLHVKLRPAAAQGGAEAPLAPLHQAILRNRNEIALFLLEAGAGVDAPDRSKRTPLHLAVERGNLALVEALLARHARPDELDKLGWTPLHHAAAKDRVAIARARRCTRRPPRATRAPPSCCCATAATWRPWTTWATRRCTPRRAT